MYRDIDQPVKVGVKFVSEEVKPVWFFWKEEKYDIEEVNLYHRSFKGEAPLHHFSVSSRGEFYKLVFDGKNLNWKLDKIWVSERG